MKPSTFVKKMTRDTRSALARWWGRPVRRPVRRPARPGLECLEDRLVPAVYNVTGLADGLGTVVQTAPGVYNATTLRAAITAADATPGADTINLTRAGTYKITLAGTPGETDNRAGEFAVFAAGGNLTIQNTSGGKAVVDGNHLCRVFDINPLATNDPATKVLITLQGFTVQNGLAQPGDGAAGSGGGIRAQGNASLTLTNMVVTGNAASADGGGIAMENATGSTPWTLTVNNSTISNNHAGDAGGGIDTDGKGLVNINAGTVIKGNSAVNQGGGIWLDAISGIVTGMTITNPGRFVYATPPTVTFTSVDGQGSGAQGIANLDFLGRLVGVTITNPGSGYDMPPTVSFSGNNPAVAATATIATFDGATLNVTGATVANNSAHGPGGGIGNAGSGAVTIADSTLLGNYSFTDGGGYGDENAADTLVVRNSTFTGNHSAGRGGGVFAGGPSVTISHSTFRGNLATVGGGVCTDQGTAVALNADLFVENAGYFEGGGAEVAGASPVITNSEFRDNNAGTSGGGGLLVKGTTFTGSGLTFADNATSGNGGAIEFQATGVGATQSFLTNSTITGNKALNNAGGTKGGGIDMGVGAFAPASGDLVLINDTLNGNFADNGGGLFWPGTTRGSAIFENTIVAGNSASAAGPDVDNPLGFVTDLGNNLIGSTSGNRGFINQGSTQFGVDPMLGDLQNNGGPAVGSAADGGALETEALLPGSPAIARGQNQYLNVGTDERGFVRAFMFGTPRPDIGAYDTQALAPVIASTVPRGGDVNPYGVAFVPANFPTGGILKPGDLLVSNFNNAGNTQGTGTTLVKITPGGGAPTTFFTSRLQGLDDALAVLKAGFVVVGNVPNTDGNGTPGPGALQFIDKNGHVVLTLTEANKLDGPWGLAINDQGSTVQLYVSNVLNGTVTRINLTIAGGTISVVSMTTIASGYAHRTDPNAFVVGPAGLAYDAASDTLYVASQADDSVYKVTGASTATDHGKGTLLVHDETHLHGPLGLALTPGGDLLVANSDGVNADPNQPSEIAKFRFVSGIAQFDSQFSVNPANGGAFGLGLTTGPNGSVTLAAVDDNTNTIAVWSTSPTLTALTLTAGSDPYQLTVNAPDPTGGPLTYAAAVVAPAAWVQQRYALYFTGSYYQNFLGANEKWLRSGNGSNAAHHGLYLLFPDGSLRAWDGGTSAYSGPLVAALDPSYWANPLLLLHPQPAAVPAGITAAFLGDSNVLQLSGFGKVRGSFGVLVTINNGTSTITELFLVTVTG
jgi:hypothetical protein